jgi:predicted ArsR family transcriptional regulator
MGKYDALDKEVLAFVSTANRTLDDVCRRFPAYGWQVLYGRLKSLQAHGLAQPTGTNPGRGRPKTTWRGVSAAGSEVK